MKHISEEISNYFSSLGKKGGDALKKKYGSEYFKELQKKGVESRKKKLSTSTLADGS